MTRLHAIAPLVLAFVAVGCEDVPPKAAPGLNAERLANISVGMPRDEVLAALGDPLLNRSSGENEALWYAQPGARWWLGEYRTNTRGYECVVWLREGRVIRARVQDTQDPTGCECTEVACAERWADPCLEVEGSRGSEEAG